MRFESGNEVREKNSDIDASDDVDLSVESQIINVRMKVSSGTQTD
jgi:hypothetical protein